MEYSHFKEHTDRVVESCSRVIVGKEETVRLIFISFLCSGHVLLEDVPGTGKTMLLKAFARTVGSGFKRIQFTPDLLPSDLTGINFYNQKTGEFQFREGPLFTNIVLADEINRATPRTQSSLLEAMEESQITVDGVTYPMAEPFFVMATQNPVESYGTFPLPEAQLDRFFMRLSLGYMTREQEMEVVSRPSTADILNSLEPVVSPEVIREMKEETGLTILNPRLVGVKQFPLENGRYVVLLFKATQWSGDLISSEEGQMEWIKYSDLSVVKTVDDFDDLLKVMNTPELTEFQYLVSGDEWTVSIR